MKAIFVLLFTIALFSAKAHFLAEISDVDWPFTDCGSFNEDLDVTQLTLASTPTRGTGASITIVREIYFRF